MLLFPTFTLWKLFVLVEFENSAKIHASQLNLDPLNLVSSAFFLMQSDWLEKKADQLHCVRKEALKMRLMPTKTMVRC